MATAVTAGTSYLIDTARTHIRERFRLAHEYLTREEAKLLRELEAIQDDYQAGYNSQVILPSMEANQSQMNNLRDSDRINLALAEINRKMNEILTFPFSGTAQTSSYFPNRYHAGEVNINTLPQPANLSPVTPQPANLPPVTPQPANLSSIIPQPANLSSVTPQPANLPPVIIPIIPIPDYKNKSKPIIACCKEGTAPGELNSPYGIAIEPQSGRIYIADSGNNRVQVFTPNGKYCFLFSSNMHGPWGICINNGTVYVSHYWSNCITAYKLNGTCVNMVGSYGTENGQFKSPAGLAVSPAIGLLYVCDSNNHRVQVFDKELKFHSLFANNILYFPHDVKLAQHLVIVLDRMDPCIHLFDITDLSLLISIISIGDNEQISGPEFFTVDRELNIILTDFGKRCICVFSQSGELITQFGKAGHSGREFYVTTGIAIDNQNRIVVVSQNKNHALQLF